MDENWKAEVESRRVRREALGLSLRDLAVKIGCSHVQVYRWEKGKALPRADVWARWEQALTPPTEEAVS